MRTITDFELVDHGIEHSQYFQGCGTAFTSFEHCATGIGDNPAEALDDLLEMVAQSGDYSDLDELEKRIRDEAGMIDWLHPSVAELEEEENENPDDGDWDCSDTYYHLSLLWNDEETPTYSVVVSSIGTVLTTTSRDEAEKTYREYVQLSKDNYGRIAGESVALLCGDEGIGELVREYEGTSPSH